MRSPTQRGPLPPISRPTIGAAWPALLVVLGTVTACRAEPVEVVEKARDALQSRDEAGFLATLTPRSAELIRRGIEVSKRSGGVFKLLRSVKPTRTLLPRGTLSEPVIDGELCTVVATKGKSAERIILRLVRGRWRIDLLEMKSFYDQTRPAEP